MATVFDLCFFSGDPPPARLTPDEYAKIKQLLGNREPT